MKNIKIGVASSIRNAMKLLNSTGENCLLVVDQNDKLLGTLTDGDLRRSILKGSNIDAKIETSMNISPKILKFGEFNKKDAGSLMIKQKIDLLPILNEDYKVIDYLTWDMIFDKEVKKRENFLLNVPVVIMAGGKGTRMEPFTKVLPKPLIPIRNKTIVEHIIERFTEIGISEFYMTVNYKSKILKAYFEELKKDYKVKFLLEEKPLGTAGSLKLFNTDNLTNSFFVSNCDIIVKENYGKIYEFHNKGNFSLTLVASTKNYEIPYGNCVLKTDGTLNYIDEKPKYDFLINTGLYVLKPEILKYIPSGEFFHITDLIEKLKSKKLKVGVFPIEDERWIDVGEWTEYKKAILKL